MDTTYQEPTAMRVTRDSDFGPKTASAVAWGAILAGAAGAAALSLILLILGTGLGLSSVSPWVNDGISASTLGMSSIVWITFTHLAASGMGGYLAGRLRTRWQAVHNDEVYFRDTAHGFLTWAVASLATAVLLTSVIGSIIGGGVKAGATLAGGVASTAASGGAAIANTETGTAASDEATGYFIDSLFRRESNGAQSQSGLGGESTDSINRSVEAASANSAEVTRIIMNSVMTGELPEEDSRYVSQLIAENTGLSPQAAEARLQETYDRLQTTLRDAEVQAKDAADTARKASAYAALWLFVSLLAGAFMASWMATFGGRLRDE